MNLSRLSSGQNFLVSPTALDRVIQAAEIDPEDVCLEIGTGVGRLTARIAACAASVVTLKTFCAMLGGFAGNVALTIGARGGVYIAGGILPRFPEFLAASDFRDRFEAKGRFRDWLAPIPTIVVTHPDPAFPGLMAMLKD